MTKQKRIKISRIEEQMLNIGSNLSIIESLSRVLNECLVEDYNLKPQDSMNLAQVLYKEICKTKNRFNKIENILNI